MLPNYKDITDRAGTPLWFDERGVPRYVEFHPQHCALPEADEAFLVEVRCQACGTPFFVALSWGSRRQPYRKDASIPNPRLTATGGTALNYGPPPNTGCCPVGTSMRSDFHRIIQGWIRTAKDVWLQLDNEAIDAIGAQSEVGSWG